MRFAFVNMPKAAAILIVAAAFVFVPAPAYSQASGGGHELRFGLGGMPFVDLVNYVTCCPDYCPLGYSTEDRFADYARNVVSCGVLSLEYSYTTGNGKNSFGASFSAEPIVGRLYDGRTDEQKGHLVSCSVSVYPSYRRTWNPRNLVNFYSGVSMGIGYMGKGFSDEVRWYDSSAGRYVEPDRVGFYPVIQFVPLGISLGRKVFGFAEMSWGTLILGGRVGIGYRFGRREI